MIRIVSLLCLVHMAALGSAAASVTTISSITQITGARMDFENTSESYTQAFADFGMSYSGFDPGHLSGEVPWVAGNANAPISGGSVHGVFTVTTTGQPWRAIGLTGVGLGIDITSVQQPSWPLTLTAFDINGQQIASETLTFHATPASSDLSDLEAAFNQAALFLGFKSDVPIYSISTSGSDVNASWDNLTFTPVPEPWSLLPMLAGGLGVLKLRRCLRRLR
jgi:hypothetical protein